MLNDLVFNPAAADAARRAKTQPAPTQHTDYIDESPRGRSRLNPTYEDRPLAALTPEAARAAGERIRATREAAVERLAEDAPFLAHKWGVPVALVQRLLSSESEVLALSGMVTSLMSEIQALKSRL